MMNDSSNSEVGETFRAPAAVARTLELIKELSTQSKPFDAVELMRELNKELRWGDGSGDSDAKDQALLRLQTHGWALQELSAWAPEPSDKLNLYRLQIVLTTLLMSSASEDGVTTVARAATTAVWNEMVSPSLLDDLGMLLKLTSVGIQSPYHRLGDQNSWREAMLAAGRSGDYSNLGNAIRHLELFLPPDVQMAIMLLAEFAPDRLARHIEERQDVFFSIAVRNALTGDAAKFALVVNDVTFKFVCAVPLANVQVADAPRGSVAVIRDLLLQAAQANHWRAWLLDFARYPQGDTVGDQALSEALAQLTPAHWSAFVDAVELWTHAPTAEAVARILVSFQHQLGVENSADMWRLAFERWNEWDYDRSKKDRYLGAPAACSFDFPVAVHYALLPLEEVLAEEASLLEAIATVEQKWFTDLIELVTFRNHLSSRLRLVQHGLVIRNSPSEGANLLPPRVAPESEFSQFRYRFSDAYAPERY